MRLRLRLNHNTAHSSVWLNVGGIFNTFENSLLQLVIIIYTLRSKKTIFEDHFAPPSPSHMFIWTKWSITGSLAGPYRRKMMQQQKNCIWCVSVSVCRFKCRQSLLAMFSILKTNFHITLFFCAMLLLISSCVLVLLFSFRSNYNTSELNEQANEKKKQNKLNQTEYAWMRHVACPILFSFSCPIWLQAIQWKKIDRRQILKFWFFSVACIWQRKRKRRRSREITPICRLVTPNKCWSKNFSRMCKCMLYTRTLHICGCKDCACVVQYLSENACVTICEQHFAKKKNDEIIRFDNRSR